MKKTYLLVIVAAVLAICSCTKVEVMKVQGEVIAVKTVPKTEGSFMLPITVAGEENLVWKVRPISKWLHVDESWTENAYNVLVKHDSNESSMTSRNFARVGYLAVETLDQFVVDTVVVKQRGITPYMELTNTSVAASETTCEIPFNSNLTDECRPNLTFSADANWVGEIKFLGCGQHLEVKISANTDVERSATITVTFTDACGEVTTADCVLTQTAF